MVGWENIVHKFGEVKSLSMGGPIDSIGSFRLPVVFVPHSFHQRVGCICISDCGLYRELTVPHGRWSCAPLLGIRSTMRTAYFAEFFLELACYFVGIDVELR